MNRFVSARSLSGVALSLAMALTPVFAQESAPSPSPSPGGGGGATAPSPSPGPTTPGGRGTSPMPRPGDQFPQDTRFPEIQRPIFLSGKVMLNDGNPPPEPVLIERVCNGQPRGEGYTDSKGRFSFQLGQNQTVLQDASVAGGIDPTFDRQSPFGGSRSGGMGTGRGDQISERDLIGCEIRAVLPGFRSDLVNLSGRRAFDNPDVGTIVLHRLANVEGLTISFTAMNAPKDAKKAFERGHKDLMKKPDKALAEYQKAVQIYPQYSSAWFEMGLVHQSQNRIPEAREAYAKALEADPKFINPYRQLALIELQEQQWQALADTTDRLVKLNPVDYADAYFYNSIANYYLKRYDAAERSARETVKLDTLSRIPKANQLLGEILIEKGDYSAAADSLKAYLKFLPAGHEDTANTTKRLRALEQVLGAREQAATP